MGYSTISTSMFHPDMQQTPENVAKVLDFAGWTYIEAAHALGVTLETIADAKRGLNPMPDLTWQKLLDACGRRAFDHDEESA